MRAWLLPILAPFIATIPVAPAGGAASASPSALFRTDADDPQHAGDHPWYALQPGEFPPAHSEHRVSGTLVAADFIHRSGQFRTDGSGELVDFTLPPFGSVYYLNAEADLRDVPLGTRLQFFLFQDGQGSFTKAVSLRDDYTQLAGQGLVYRIDEVKAGTNGSSALGVTLQKPGQSQPGAGRAQLIVTGQTRLWKGDQRIKLADLVVGDELLANVTGAAGPESGYCTEIWVGAETQHQATERQRKQHTAFLKLRGLPAWVDRVEGKKLVVTLFGDSVGLEALCKDEGIAPEQWAKEHRRVGAAVANDELRTYNPENDREDSAILDFRRLPTDPYGCSGVQWTIEPNLLLEGFRKGRIIRLFPPSWPVADMPFGEGLYTERPGAKDEEMSPNQFPYRTDFGNAHLTWYRLKPGVFPPYESHHLVTGELLKADAANRTGQFRVDRTGTLVDFTMLPFTVVRYLNADADLQDLPLGTRYRFYLHPDEKGEFTRASIVEDEFTHAVDEKLTLRLEVARLDEGKLVLAQQLAPLRDDKDHLVRPPDLAHGEYTVDGQTRLWKGDRQIQLADLVVGDELLVNVAGSTATSARRCTDIWVGPETYTHATDQQRARQTAFLQEHGLPAWIDSVDKKTLTITFFAGDRKDFEKALGPDPGGKTVSTILCDDKLHPEGAAMDIMRYANHLPEAATAGTYGCSGIRWVLESDHLPDGYRAGRVIRVFKEEWASKHGAGKQ